mmetsp:Transcript_88137/g.139304  ORF Transcript_88137/g.139304 Transcript_88137/m.139304 type:complete len:222 (+) Transcript_88137:56-721(+)
MRDMTIYLASGCILVMLAPSALANPAYMRRQEDVEGHMANEVGSKGILTKTAPQKEPRTFPRGSFVDEGAGDEVNSAKYLADKKLYLVDGRSAARIAFEATQEAKLKRVKAWVNAAKNQPEDFEDSGPANLKGLTEMSKAKIASGKQGYDGLKAVASGSWASDRLWEKRVDWDHKIYTWRQYRSLYPHRHTWTVEQQWKKLPTLKRVKRLGHKAFIQRFGR